MTTAEVTGPVRLEGWRELAVAHETRADELTAPRRDRRGRGAVDAVDDFLYDYYALRPGQLRRWHPGAGAVLVDAAGSPHADWRWYRRSGSAGTDVTLDVAAFTADRGRAVATSHRLLSAVAGRTPHLGCFGLHEWAMVYRAGDAVAGPTTGAASPFGRRHGLPLRLGQAGTDAVVEGHALRCSHVDAHRFFTPEAVPRNALLPTRADQAELDQPGCVHVTMDVLRHALVLGPACPGELLLDCFVLARDARDVDMRASPYDVSGHGLPAIAIETREGKAEYAAAQRDLAERSAPLRQRLLGVCAAVSETVSEAVL